MSSPTWTVAQAKARFSEVIDKAESDGPQTITPQWTHYGRDRSRQGMGKEDQA